MAISHSSFTFLSLSLTMFSYLIFTCSSVLSNQLLSESQIIATDQIKFWSVNVQNKMPKSIMNKLSPLTRKDCEFFSILISQTDKFTANANFCSLAKLACKSIFDTVKTVKNTYTTTKTYGQSSAFHNQKTIEDPYSYFRLSILKNDNLVHLPNLIDSLPDRAFLPHQMASKISLASAQNILKIFTESAFGTTKETIETSISYCNDAEVKGEIQSCPKSLEEMISFSKSILGGKKIFSLTSKNTKGSNTELKIKNMKKFNADKIVSCHEVFLPFAAYFCHSISSSNLYKVDVVEPETGALVNTMIAICHMDTSSWPANHVAFQILKLVPGQGEACHWITQLDLAWISDVE